ncbi:MAG: carbohydrate binding domain-containing protein [Bryobacteraceae bacterium]
MASCFLAAACALQAQSYTSRVNFGARLEPQGALMHGAGQSPDAFAAYWGVMPAGNQPVVYMYYIDLAGLPSNWSDDLKTQLMAYPNSFIIPQVGLTMSHGVGTGGPYEVQVAAGAYDQQIANLVTGLQRLATPVYLRIGYEFNGVLWNGYKPATYQQAFIRVTNAIRAANLEVATVWDASADAADSGVTDYFDYYPGDQYVDWFGMNMYGTSMFDQDPALTPFFAQAVARQKPVMLAEESPRYVGAQDGATSWSGWFAPFFSFLETTPVVKQFDYIDWNWANYPQWSTWGDARLETAAATYVRSLYIAQLANPVMLNAGSETAFRKLLGYNNSTPPPAVTDLSAAAAPGGIELTWTPVQDPSGIARYYIYRNNTFLSFWLGSGFVDTTAALGTEYSYTVAAMDRAGNLSALSNAAVITATTLETLQNSGFEDGLANWQVQALSSAVGNVVADTTNPIDGSVSAELTVSHSTGTNWDLTFYQPFNITQGLTYTISFMARASAPLSLPVVIQEAASPNKVYLWNAAAVGTSASKFEYFFVAPASGVVNMAFYFGNINPNTLWLDDVLVQESQQQLLNGNFEDGLTGWWFNAVSPAVGNAVADTTKPIDGSASARLTVTNSTGTDWNLQLGQAFTMVQGLTYTLSFAARASAPVSLPVFIQEAGGAYTLYLNPEPPPAVATTAHTFEYSFVAPVSGIVDLVFDFGNIDTTTVWVDDVSVIESNPAMFADVPSSATYFDAANLMFQAGVTTGCQQSSNPSTRLYCPDDNVTRQEMAAFIVRAVTGTTTPAIYNTTPYFNDVPASNSFFPHIQKMMELGITSGCSQSPPLFCPTDTIPRWEMAMFMIRARLMLHGASFNPQSSTPYFTDVPTNVEGNGMPFPFIQRSSEEHITNGCGGGLYCPDELVTRGQMASFIMRGLFNETMALPMSAPASLLAVTPNAVAATVGSKIAVTITGSNTSFKSGDTVTVPSGMLTVSNVVVNSATSITATLTMNSATAGPQALVVTSGGQNLTLPLAIKVGTY